MTKLRTHRLFTFIPPQRWDGGSLEKLSLPAMVGIVVLFCAAALIAASAQSVFFTTLANFDGTNGAHPYAALVQGSDGNFYGTTTAGGDLACNAPYGCGTIFKMTPSGTLTTLYTGGDGFDGTNPKAALVQATDGNFYGTTEGGGADDVGTVFKITPNGTLTTLHSFGMSDGCDPDAGLVQTTDGNFYGTTPSCGPNDLYSVGTVFKFTPNGYGLTTLYSFCDQNGCPDGCGPNALVQATDGNLYGTTVLGGNSSSGCVVLGPFWGTVFRITPDGTLTTLHRFDDSDGATPSAGLVQATDGNLYGTTSSGGANDAGTVFKISPNGTFTTLYNFCSQPNCADGGAPVAGLVQARDGDFHGMTPTGGQYQDCNGGGCGTVFKMTPSGTLTTLHSFDGTDGASPYGGLMQAANGFFYGTTHGGGADGYGTVFRLGVPRSCATCAP